MDGDSSGGAMPHCTNSQSFKVSGYEKVEEEGALIKTWTRKVVMQSQRVVQGKDVFSFPLFEADVVINLPKQKPIRPMYIRER